MEIECYKKFIYLKIFKKSKWPDGYLLCAIYNFFYTQLASAFVPQRFLLHSP